MEELVFCNKLTSMITAMTHKPVYIPNMSISFQLQGEEGSAWIHGSDRV